MMTYRFKRFISFLTSPASGHDKDGKILVKYLVNVVGHGLSEVFKQLPQKFGGGPWWVSIVDEQHLEAPASSSGTSTRRRRPRSRITNTRNTGRRYLIAIPHPPNVDIVKEVLESPDRFKRNGAFNVSAIMGEFDIGRDRARGIKAKVESKNREEPAWGPWGCFRVSLSVYVSHLPEIAALPPLPLMIHAQMQLNMVILLQKGGDACLSHE